MTDDDCTTTEQPWNLPLPAPKTQWEARSEESWLQELGAGLSTMTTFGELVNAKRRRTEPQYAENLDSWNSGSDTMGHFLNLAANMISNLPRDGAVAI